MLIVLLNYSIVIFLPLLIYTPFFTGLLSNLWPPRSYHSSPNVISPVWVSSVPMFVAVPSAFRRITLMVSGRVSGLPLSALAPEDFHEFLRPFGSKNSVSEDCANRTVIGILPQNIENLMFEVIAKHLPALLVRILGRILRTGPVVFGLQFSITAGIIDGSKVRRRSFFISATTAIIYHTA